MAGVCKASISPKMCAPVRGSVAVVTRFLHFTYHRRSGHLE